MRTVQQCSGNHVCLRCAKISCLVQRPAPDFEPVQLLLMCKTHTHTYAHAAVFGDNCGFVDTDCVLVRRTRLLLCAIT